MYDSMKDCGLDERPTTRQVVKASGSFGDAFGGDLRKVSDSIAPATGRPSAARAAFLAGVEKIERLAEQQSTPHLRAAYMVKASKLRDILREMDERLIDFRKALEKVEAL